MIVHLIDGTYELSRHFYGIRRFKKTDPPFGAVAGVLNTVAKMIEDGATDLGVAPEFIPDYLALVGDAADGYPGIKGLGPRTAASLISRHGHIEEFPAGTISDANLELALLFKKLATLRTDLPLFKGIDDLRWTGPVSSFAAVSEKIGEVRLANRVMKLAIRPRPDL